MAPGLPTMDVIDFALSIEKFWQRGDSTSSFSRYMTGQKIDDTPGSWPPANGPDLLSRVFNWIGGTATTSELQGYRERVSNPAADPLFWLSIGYSDLITEQWMRTAAEGGVLDTALLPTKAVTGLNVDEYVPGLTPLAANVDMFVLSTDLGYSYDSFDS